MAAERRTRKDCGTVGQGKPTGVIEVQGQEAFRLEVFAMRVRWWFDVAALA